MKEEAIRVTDVTHRYARVCALQHINLSIEQGEFITFLGPSGCGKTTLLRIMAGFLRPTAGSVHLLGRDVTSVPPHKRPVNTVFQRPSLFPHLNVGQNIAFSLDLAGAPKSEIERRVEETLALVKLDGFQQRRSHELSGGQMQRVALARVLIARPRVLLLDEPLSALDLAIRLEMESELRRVHREIGGTFVYVTHDQREALALSDRMVVFNRGQIEQIGRPDEIYRSPRSAFVARFVGNANVLPANVVALERDGATIEIGGARLPAPNGSLKPGPAQLIVRQEAITVVASNSLARSGFEGTIRDFAYRGSGYAYQIEVDGLSELLRAEVPSSGNKPFGVGSRVSLSWSQNTSLIQPPDGALAASGTGRI